MLYVFGREGVDVLHCVSAFRELYPDRQADILVLYDTVYAHCIGRIYKGKSLMKINHGL